MVIEMDLIDQGRVILATSVEATFTHWDMLHTNAVEVVLMTHGREFQTHFKSVIDEEMKRWEKTFSNDAARYHMSALMTKHLEFWDKPYYWFVVSTPMFDLLFIGAGRDVLIFRVDPQNQKPLRAYAKKSRSYLNWQRNAFMNLLAEKPMKAHKIAREAWLKAGKPVVGSRNALNEVESECSKLVSNVVNIK